jgi:hypothetical protein
MKLPIDIGIMMRWVNLFWQFCFFSQFLPLAMGCLINFSKLLPWETWRFDQVPKKSQGESLIYLGDYLCVENCTTSWEIQANDNLPENDELSSAPTAGYGDPIFSRCFFLWMISCSFSLFWRLFCIGASHYLFTDLGFWAGCALCF